MCGDNAAELGRGLYSVDEAVNYQVAGTLGMSRRVAGLVGRIVAVHTSVAVKPSPKAPSVARDITSTLG